MNMFLVKFIYKYRLLKSCSVIVSVGGWQKVMDKTVWSMHQSNIQTDVEDDSMHQASNILQCNGKLWKPEEKIF